MIRDESFWQDELEAPLLNRNAGFIRPDAVDALVERALHWVDLTESKGEKVELETWLTSCANKESQRIFELDAERTFKTQKHRQDLVETLATIYNETADYHQGMGFVVAFLLLFLEKKEVARLVIALHRYYVPGYFKAAPVAYVRDAKTFEKILQKVNPKAYKHVTSLIPAEAYCSKWFVGFNVHVLPFSAVADFLDALLSEGEIFHFQYAVSLVNQIMPDLLATRDVGKVLAYLRLDPVEYPDEKADMATESAAPGSFFDKIVENARQIDLSHIDIEKIRREVLADMEEADRRRKQRDAELEEDDDEIVFSDEE